MRAMCTVRITRGLSMAKALHIGFETRQLLYRQGREENQIVVSKNYGDFIQQNLKGQFSCIRLLLMLSWKMLY